MRIQVAFIYLTAFVLGNVVMGYEMIAIRFLTPYFGSGVEAWSGLISIFLLALMVGYYCGGYIADKVKNAWVVPLIFLSAAVFFFVFPPFRQGVILWIAEVFGVELVGILLASITAAMIPLLSLGMFLPIAVRMCLPDTTRAGRVAGTLYAISTLGNVVGTLGTTFVLIPVFSLTNISFIFGGTTIVAILLFLCYRGVARRAAVAGAAACVLAVGVTLAGNSRPAMAEDGLCIQAVYPEGAIWIGNDLLYADMRTNALHRVSSAGDAGVTLPYPCGPTAIAPYGDGYMIACHQESYLLQVDEAFGNATPIANLSGLSERPSGPNDCFADGDGGVYCSLPGLFKVPSADDGLVIHVDPAGDVTVIADGYRYSNGVTLSRDGTKLYVSEHLGGRVTQIAVHDDGTYGAPETFAEVTPFLQEEVVMLQHAGPDGLEVDEWGNVYVAVYGTGNVVIYDADGHRKRVLRNFAPYVTSVAIQDELGLVAVVGAGDAIGAPQPCNVNIFQFRADG